MTISKPGPKVIVGTEPAALGRALAGAGLPVGRPVVVLIGGAAKLDDATAAKVEPFVRHGIIAVAQRAGATVLDGGTDAGAMSLAGRAHHELAATVPLVGVAPAGRVTLAGATAATGSTPIEPNHTHVLLAPGGEWSDESPWLVEAARVLSGGKPIVAVVVDGGQVASVEATKVRAEGWPLIALAGSGRTADDLARLARRGAGGGAAEASAIVVTDIADGAPALAALLHALLAGGQPTAGAQAAGDRIELPALYVVASEASRRGQRWYKRLSLLELGLTLFALFVVVAGSLVPLTGLPMDAWERTGLVIFTAGGFFAAFALKLFNHSLGYDKDWHTGRAIAEGVKSQAWRYMMRINPYDGDDADEQFTAELGGLARRAGDIRQAVDRIGPRPRQISASMRRIRDDDLAGRRELYARRRLHEQAAWYASRSARHQRWASRWFWLSVICQLIAAAFAFLAVHLAAEHAAAALDLGQLFVRAMSAFAATAIALSAWTQLNRDDELGRAYAQAFQELTLIATGAERATTEAGLATVVNDGEEAISRENHAWMAKRADRYESPDFTISS